MVSPGHKREAVKEVVEEGLCSRRAACRYLKLHWSSFCYQAKEAVEKVIRLVQAIIQTSKEHPRYGYRRIRASLEREGWQVSKKFVQKVRRAEAQATAARPFHRPNPDYRDSSQPCLELGLGLLWSCRPSGSVVADRTDEGAPLRVLSLIDEFTRECILLKVARGLKAADIIAALGKAIAKRGAPEHIRNDNGPEFIATATKEYLEENKIKTLYIEPGSQSRRKSYGPKPGSIPALCWRGLRPAHRHPDSGQRPFPPHP